MTIKRSELLPRWRGRLQLFSIAKIVLGVFVIAIAPWGYSQTGSAERVAGARPSKSTVILISIDGFRYDYPEKVATPNLHRLIRRGARAAGLIPQFPTLTF